MTVQQNYVGKKIDLCVLETGSVEGEAPVNVAITDSGLVVAGPYKVVQKFVKYLLTSKGSVASDTEYGSTFIIKLLGGHISTSMGLLLEFYTDLPDILNYIKTSVLVPTAEENLLKVVIENFYVTPGSATMRLVFSFEDSSVITAPVNISTV